MVVRALLSALVLMTASLAAPALAQTPTAPSNPSGSGQPPPGAGDASGSTSSTERDRVRQETENTYNRARADQRNASRDRRNRARSAEEQLASATAAAAASGLTCPVTAGVALGRTDEGTAYEVTCDNGVGYMLTSTTPPTAYNCLVVAGNAARAKAEDPTSDMATCTLPANQDAVAMVAPAVREAGIACTPDAAQWIGRTPEGKERFEIGCAGVEGAWLEVAQTGGSTTKFDCIEVIAAGRACSLSTAAEVAAGVRARLGSSNPECQVEQARYAGRNADGKFYEAKCTGADGVMALVSPDGAVSQTWMCADAARVVGGCTLTTAAPTQP